MVINLKPSRRNLRNYFFLWCGLQHLWCLIKGKVDETLRVPYPIVNSLNSFRCNFHFHLISMRKLLLARTLLKIMIWLWYFYFHWEMKFKYYSLNSAFLFSMLVRLFSMCTICACFVHAPLIFIGGLFPVCFQCVSAFLRCYRVFKKKATLIKFLKLIPPSQKFLKKIDF